jgi:cold shock CspA family protein
LEDYPENFWITSYLSGLSRNFQYKKLLCRWFKGVGVTEN